MAKEEERFRVYRDGAFKDADDKNNYMLLGYKGVITAESLTEKPKQPKSKIVVRTVETTWVKDSTVCTKTEMRILKRQSVNWEWFIEFCAECGNDLPFSIPTAFPGVYEILVNEYRDWEGDIDLKFTFKKIS